MPKGFIYASLILLTLALIPPALIATARALNSPVPRIQLLQDMGSQYKFQAQQGNPMFADGRAMRPKVEGTIARGEMRDDDHYYRGVFPAGSTQFAESFPDRVQLTMELMNRGQERYNIYCAICHGTAGYGDGMVHRRAVELQELAVQGTTWVPPTNLHEAQVLDMPVGQIFHTISVGARNMPAYGHAIPEADRWAIVAYVRALQRSQNARPEDAR